VEVEVLEELDEPPEPVEPLGTQLAVLVLGSTTHV
jgi:hypothetical protein